MKRSLRHLPSRWSLLRAQLATFVEDASNRRLQQQQQKRDEQHRWRETLLKDLLSWGMMSAEEKEAWLAENTALPETWDSMNESERNRHICGERWLRLSPLPCWYRADPLHVAFRPERDCEADPTAAAKRAERAQTYICENIIEIEALFKEEDLDPPSDTDFKRLISSLSPAAGGGDALGSPRAAHARRARRPRRPRSASCAARTRRRAARAPSV